MGTMDTPVEHGIESRNLIHPHGRHGEKFCNIVHDADTRPPLVLPLCEVEQRNYGRLLVLRWVVGNNLIGPCKIFGSKFKGNLSVQCRVI